MNVFLSDDYKKHPSANSLGNRTNASLWNVSTTVREAERIRGFLSVASLMEGEKWNIDGQKRFQYLLVQKKQYLNDPSNSQNFKKLNKQQCNALLASEEMPYNMAVSIIEAKQYEGGAEMRGRQSMAPLRKMGLVYIDESDTVRITDLGQKLIRNEISNDAFFLDSLLKVQYPNPLDTSYPYLNIKPFVATLTLISKVNEECKKRCVTPKGITKDEFGIFALSLIDYQAIDKTVKCLLAYREKINSLHDDQEKEAFKEEYIKEYLKNFKGASDNVREYTDNMIRYMRQTKLIYIRGKYAHVYIDLEPRRSTEIASILNIDKGEPLPFSTKKEYIAYLGTYGTYELPYETTTALKTILEKVSEENQQLAADLGKKADHAPSSLATKQDYKSAIEFQRQQRTSLQNLKLKKEFFEPAKIDEAIDMLKRILRRDRTMTNRPSLELEKWANVALNIFNDALLIKPNTSVGDDNEPINTAPAGVPDIECRYSSFDSICEVTTLTGRDQWYNEGQPVMRHLRDFEDKTDKPCYCLFLAPKIHQDTMNTFWMSVHYEYQGKKQKIIPLTIEQLISMLEVVKALHQNGQALSSKDFQELLDTCSATSTLSSSEKWMASISDSIQSWHPKASTNN